MSRTSAVLQRYPSIDDDGRKDSLIYSIERKSDNKVIYVGQTTTDRESSRWYEHVTKDSWAPWYVHVAPSGIDYSKPRSTWPFDYVIEEKLKDVTKFETTVAEQWWLEHYLTAGNTLLNDSTPCTLECFKKRSGDASLYEAKNISVSDSYKPSMKAK